MLCVYEAMNLAAQLHWHTWLAFLYIDACISCYIFYLLHYKDGAYYKFNVETRNVEALCPEGTSIYLVTYGFAPCLSVDLALNIAYVMVNLICIFVYCCSYFT